MFWTAGYGMTPMRQKPFAWQDFSGAGKYVVILLFLGSVYSKIRVSTALHGMCRTKILDDRIAETAERKPCIVKTCSQ